MLITYHMSGDCVIAALLGSSTRLEEFVGFVSFDSVIYDKYVTVGRAD